MKFSLLLLSFLFAAINISAQDAEPLVCPVVRVAGPTAGPKDKLPERATAKFTALVEPQKPEDHLRYFWHLSSGTIVSGDGTKTIEVQNKIHYVTATVDVDGFRTDGICPRVASETVWWDVQPTAEKISSFSGEKFEPTIYDSQVLEDVWPDTTLHIIFGHKKNVSKEAAQNKENDVLEWIGNKLDRSRITTEHVYRGADLIEFWRVPSGAKIPNCAECEPECPTLTVTGPAGIVPPGELAEYTATVEQSNERANLKYVWTTSSGTIETGQGTPKIKVRISDNSCLTVTVEVIGFTGDCPARASETSCADPPPQPTKLDTFSLPLNSISEERFQKIADAINNDPASQMYILVPSDRAVRNSLVSRLDKYIRKGIDTARITIVEANGMNKIVEIWVVPPGATPPSKCEACEQAETDKQACPQISIEGPPGLTFVGNIMKFTVDKPKDFSGKYRWTVSQGTIESGQGSPSIEVRAPEVPDSVNVTVSVELIGLPEKCVNTASETAGVYREFLPTAADVYGRLSKNEEKARLQSAFAHLGQVRDGVGVIIIRVPKTGKITYESRVQAIKSALKWLRLDVNKAFFVRGDPGELSTTIYLVPREAASSFAKP